jgi:hypothetical protein
LEKDIEPLLDPPFGIEGKKAVAFNPGNGALLMKLRGSDLRRRAANPGNRISTEGRVEPKHRVEMAKVNLGTGPLGEKA